MKYNIDFMSYLAIVSILGFVVIIIDRLTGIDISPWVSGLIVIIIGIGLTFIGSFWSMVDFSNGLTPNEIAHILTTIVGALAVIVGILIMPIKVLEFMRVPALDGVIVIVCIFAIVLISIETWLVKR